MSKRRIYDRRVWSFALLHHEAKALATLLRNDAEFVVSIGGNMESAWLSIDALADGKFVLADFAPLVNHRSHAYGGSHDFESKEIAEQYRSLLSLMCLLKAPDDRTRLALAYMLSLQDRCDDAYAQAALVHRERIDAKMQLDYLLAYLALARSELDQARALCLPYRDYPVAEWRLRFSEVLAQLEEIAGRVPDREAALRNAQRQQLQAERAATFHATITEQGAIHLAYAHLERCTIRYHHLDLELLFSRDPFANAVVDRCTLVKAEVEQVVELDQHVMAQDIPLPESLRNRNLAIEISAAGERQLLSSFANVLDLRMAPREGQLQVLHAGDGKPLSTVYVKVYVEDASGVVRYHKDGYTDLRGRFDYASVSEGSLAGCKRLALFVEAAGYGSTVQQVSPP